MSNTNARDTAGHRSVRTADRGVPPDSLKHNSAYLPFTVSSLGVVFIGQKGVPAEFPGTSGVEFYVERRATDLARDGIPVVCYVRPWATPVSTVRYEGVDIIHLPTINTKYLDATVHSALGSLAACRLSAGTVWYQAMGPAFFSFIPKLFGKRIVVTIHGLDWKRDKWGPLAKLTLRLMEAVAVRTADVLVVVSEDLKRYYQTTYGRTALVDPPLLDAAGMYKPALITQKYGLKGNDYILFMGRFVPEKRIEWLIEAFRTVRPPGVQLVIAGGSSHSDRYTEKLRAMAGKDTGILFPGYVFGREKQELLGNCRFFVLPSSLEGNPVVIHELRLFGKTMLIGDSYGREYPRDDIRLHRFASDSKDGFIEAFRRLSR